MAEETTKQRQQQAQGMTFESLVLPTIVPRIAREPEMTIEEGEGRKEECQGCNSSFFSGYGYVGTTRGGK